MNEKYICYRVPIFYGSRENLIFVFVIMVTIKHVNHCLEQILVSNRGRVFVPSQ
ncbi:hypothetical protein Scep_020209 [Stephania cephalantha]|uniref:Uncharacterized protein n=1 Tax=Stephania cephalantha TaxID=152367 RepID=A0AAP0NP20_9MAGN